MALEAPIVKNATVNMAESKNATVNMPEPKNVTQVTAQTPEKNATTAVV